MEEIVGLLAGVIIFYKFYNQLIKEERKLNKISTLINKIKTMEDATDIARWRDLKEVKSDLKELFKEFKSDVKDDIKSFKESVHTLETTVKGVKKTMIRYRYQLILLIVILAPSGVINAIDLYKQIMAALG